MAFAWSLALVLPAVRAGAGQSGDGHDDSSNLVVELQALT
jgi:hypothetical protein